MRTVVRINKKTAKTTFDVEDGQGTQCREKNAHYYERMGREFGLPATDFNETEKPEMNQAVDTQTEAEHE